MAYDHSHGSDPYAAIPTKKNQSESLDLPQIWQIWMVIDRV